MNRNWVILSAVLLMSGFARADEPPKTETPKKEAYVVTLEARTSQEQTVKFIITSPIVAMGTKLGARICEDTGAEVKSLTTKDSEGSLTAAQVVKHEEKCTQIADLYFPKAGNGKVNVEFSNGDSASLAVAVAEKLEVKDQVIAFTRSTDGKVAYIALMSDKITTETAMAAVCTNGSASLSSAKLFMVKHGHGSSPTSLESLSDGCVQVNDIEFTMPGEWEIRLRFTDKDTATFTVNVARLLPK